MKKYFLICLTLLAGMFLLSKTANAAKRAEASHDAPAHKESYSVIFNIVSTRLCLKTKR